MKTFQKLVIDVNSVEARHTTTTTVATIDAIQEALNQLIKIHHPGNLGLKLKVSLNLFCFNNFTQAPESIRSTRTFIGEAATYHLANFGNAVINELKCHYMLPNEPKIIPVCDDPTYQAEAAVVDRSPFGVSTEEHRTEEDRVEAGRNGSPMRGITKRKRPTYTILWKILSDNKQKRAMFINQCAKNYGVSKTTALKWYSMLQAVGYQKIPCYAKWPGNEVMLKHYHDKTTRPVICDLYDISMSTFTVWQALIKEVLLKSPDVTVTSLY